MQIFDLPMRIVVRDYKSVDSPAACRTMTDESNHGSVIRTGPLVIARKVTAFLSFCCVEASDALQVLLPEPVLYSFFSQ